MSRVRRITATTVPTAIAAICCIALSACTQELGPTDGGANDGSANVDMDVVEAGPRTTLSFTIVGCAHLELTALGPVCTGRLPLTVTFVPLYDGIETFAWTFPGGLPSVSAELSPQVKFSSVGSYNVTLGGGGAGGTQVARGSVQVTTGGLAEPCVFDQDCSNGLACFCAGGVCSGAFASGICSRACSGQSCGPSQLCADFSRGRTLDPDAGAQSVTMLASALCMPSCTDDAACRTGLSCVEVPSLAPGQGEGGIYSWQRVCASSQPAAVGGACLDASAAVDDAACLSGRCESLGARGLCTADCANVECPSFAGCATFVAGGLGAMCLVRCDAQHPCSDPLMACSGVGGVGGWAFTVSPGEPVGATYCAPKRCALESECTPAGHCTAFGAASFCAR